MSLKPFESSVDSNLLQQILEQFKNPGAERNIRQLFEAINPSSVEALGAALQLLLESHRLAARYRVHAPSGDGLRDFANFAQIPKVMEDDSQDPPRKFKVGLTDIEVVFSQGRLG